MLDFDFVEWDDGNIGHIADNGLTIEEVEDVLYDPRTRPTPSRSSGRPVVIGETTSGKTILVVYERHKDAGYTIVRPATAYEIEG